MGLQSFLENMRTRYDEVIKLCGSLKRLPRKGWLIGNVKDSESVSEHSMRVSFLAMLLCPKGLDKDKCIRMGVIHDLAESIMGDLTPLCGVSQEMKRKREEEAWSYISRSLGDNELETLWTEFENGETPEARFMNELDKLEMLIQAEEYENEQNIDLSSFFKFDNFFTFDETKEIYTSIMQRRLQRDPK